MGHETKLLPKSLSPSHPCDGRRILGRAGSVVYAYGRAKRVAVRSARCRFQRPDFSIAEVSRPGRPLTGHDPPAYTCRVTIRTSTPPGPASAGSSRNLTRIRRAIPHHSGSRPARDSRRATRGPRDGAHSESPPRCASRPAPRRSWRRGESALPAHVGRPGPTEELKL